MSPIMKLCIVGGVTAVASVLVFPVAWNGAASSASPTAVESGSDGGVRDVCVASRLRSPGHDVGIEIVERPAEFFEISEAPAGWSKLHAQRVAHFVDAPGFGVSRLRVEPWHSRWLTLRDASTNSRPDNVTVESVQLLSLRRDRETGEEDVAYLHTTLPSMRTLRSRAASDVVEKRELTPFEVEGVRRLRAGANVLAAEENGHPVMLGAIRASEKCASCHDNKPGDLLGAFSYQLVR